MEHLKTHSCPLGETHTQIYEYAETDLQIYKAALNNKWAHVCDLFIDRPKLMTKPVNERSETPLMIAVGTNSSHEFVNQLLNNVTPLNRDNWCFTNKSGNNVFHYAAQVGNMDDARLMAGCLPLWTISTLENSRGYTPVLLAAKLGRKDMVHEFFKKEYTVKDDQKRHLVIHAIQTEHADMVLVILCHIKPDAIPADALEALATKPEFFPSGNRLGFWGGLIYPWMPIIGIGILEQVTGEKYVQV